MIKRVFGYGFLLAGILLVLSQGITGAAIGAVNNVGFTALLLIFISFVLFYVEGSDISGKDLEKIVGGSTDASAGDDANAASKDASTNTDDANAPVQDYGNAPEGDNKPPKKKKGYLGKVIVGAGLAAGAVGGVHVYNGSGIRDTVNMAEQGYKVMQVVGNALPGQSYNAKALEEYALGGNNDIGKTYLGNRASNEEYLKRLATAGETSSDAAGYGTKRGLKDRLGERLHDFGNAVGKAITPKSQEKRSKDQYEENYDRLAKLKINATVFLNHINSSIDDLVDKLMKKGAKASDNSQAITELNSRMTQANSFYDWIKQVDSLTVDQIHKGVEDPKFKEITDADIVSPDYHWDDWGAAVAAGLGAVGAGYVIKAGKKVGRAVKYTGKAVTAPLNISKSALDKLKKPKNNPRPRGR